MSAEEVIRDCYSVLEENLSPLTPILGRLYQCRIINNDQKQEIRDTKTSRQQVWLLVDDILPTKNLADLEEFCSVLEESEKRDGCYVHGVAAKALRGAIEEAKRNPYHRKEQHSSRPKHSAGRDKQSNSSTSPGRYAQTITMDGNTFTNCDVNIFGTHHGPPNRGKPGPPQSRSTPPRAPCSPPSTSSTRAEKERKPEEGLASLPPPSYHTPQPSLPTPQSTAVAMEVSQDYQATPLDLSPSVEDLRIHIFPAVGTRLQLFCQRLGIEGEVERDGRAVEETIKTEQPNLTWKQVLGALHSMGLGGEASVLLNRLMSKMTV